MNCNCPNCPDSQHSEPDVKSNVCTVDEAVGALQDGAAEYDHPFAAKDLVIAQVGWRDRESGAFYGLRQYVHTPMTIEEAAKRIHLRAVYEIAGRHYSEPGPY